MKKWATLSPDGMYRYLLGRQWDYTSPLLRVCWIMLNPSTADAKIDDPTIRRCIAFSKRWGFSSLEVVNLFAFRATSPKALYTAAKAAIGPENDRYLVEAVHRAQMIVCAWGSHGTLFQRGNNVLSVLSSFHHQLWALGMTKMTRQPMHPLYLAADTKPKRIKDVS